MRVELFPRKDIAMFSNRVEDFDILFGGFGISCWFSKKIDFSRLQAGRYSYWSGRDGCEVSVRIPAKGERI